MVIENDTIESGTHDFLLTFHSNHRPISHRFRDKRRFPSKIAKFSHHLARTEGVPLGVGYRRKGSKKLPMIELPDGHQKFKIGLVV